MYKCVFVFGSSMHHCNMRFYGSPQRVRGRFGQEIRLEQLGQSLTEGAVELSDIQEIVD